MTKWRMSRRAMEGNKTGQKKGGTMMREGREQNDKTGRDGRKQEGGGVSDDWGRSQSAAAG